MAVVEEYGGMYMEIRDRLGAAWGNCKKCRGVLRDRNIPVKLKGNVCRTVVRPALL